ncbi:DUF7009 family protein [Pontibacter harenae]|uniref:DUF7009 family protein n=1 Tax=Pontibacter harenae TaxID=2894083 RepID=UPI001E4FA3C8|nr:hypothetical protein [Pontibacter harenae]MCC9167713.1 hypothetical protein [Pontibacter harenae]
MKIRILGNSIRFRLREPEVQQFQRSGNVTETTTFGPEPTDQIKFVLEQSVETELAINYNLGTTIIKVPKHLAEEWVGTNLVGFEGTVVTGKGQRIELLVEKDFVCLDRPDEENEGAYPHPKTVC